MPQLITIEYLRKNNLILLEAISGSKAYGTNLPHSDEDIRGIFILPENQILGMNYIEQVNDDKNDIVFYEIKRFLQLLSTNNPTIMELLNIPSDCLIFQHPVFEKIISKRDLFITKKCKNTFGGYAIEQIKKARGLNKKMMQPVGKERKTPLDFCTVVSESGYGSLSLTDYLKIKNWNQSDCGLTAIPNMREVYALFYSPNGIFKGIIKNDNSNDIMLNSVPEGIKPETTLSYNKDGYSAYCKKYKEYWGWVEKRNEDRYNQNMEVGKGYDTKNMMHCHRLLDMAIEIGQGKGIQVRRPNREQLLQIRSGNYEYEQLLEEAEKKIKFMDEVYENSKLPDDIDFQVIENILIDIRNTVYNKDSL